MFESIIELYEIVYGDQTLRFCNNSKSISFQGFEFYPLRGVSRTNIVDEDINQTSFEIDIPQKQRNALAQASLNQLIGNLRGLIFYGSIKIKVIEYYRNGNTGLTQFIGRIAYPQILDAKGLVKLSCESNESQQRRSINVRKLQASCNNKMFDRFCGLIYEDWAFKIVVTDFSKSMQNPTIAFEVVPTPDLDEDGQPILGVDGEPVLSANEYPNGFLTGGLLKLQNHFKTITNHEAFVLTLYSNDFNVEIGQIIDVSPACDQSLKSCKKFNNDTRFCGFLNSPNENPINAQFIK